MSIYFNNVKHKMDFNRIDYINESEYKSLLDGSITLITIPQTITTIVDNSFKGCKQLQTVVIPNHVDWLGWECFMNCTALESVTFEKPCQITETDSYCFANCGFKTFEIPNSMTLLCEGFFDGCSSLETVTFEENSQMTEFSYSCFYGCTSLKNIELPDSLEYIADTCFYNCTSLTEITIPSSVEFIASDAFYNCPNLTTIIVNQSEDSIEEAPWGAENATIVWNG